MMKVPELHREPADQHKEFFQDKDSFILQEGEGGSAADFRISLGKNKDKTDADIMAELKESISGKYWWLNDYWRNKGEPLEQIRCAIGSKIIDVFNFFRPLTREEIMSIQRSLELVANIGEGELLNNINFILINNEQPINPKSGEPTYGQNASRSAGYFRLDPRTLNEKDIARMPGARCLEAIIVHECGHSASTQLQNRWNETMGWYSNTVHRLPLKSGADTVWRNDHPENMINDYARQDGGEDFCESFAAALLTPEILDPKRFAFIQEHFLSKLKSQKERTPVVAIRLTDKEMQAPSIQTVTYKRRSSSLISLKRLE